MRKKIFGALASLFMVSLLPSCAGFKNDDNANVKKETFRFYNYSQEYKVKDTDLDLYFVNDRDLPYVSVKEITDKLDGYINSSTMKHRKNNLFNRYVMTWGPIIQRMNCSFNWEANTITVDDPYFFYNNPATEATDYMEFLEDGDMYVSSVNGKQFDLGKYGFDILNYKGEILIPLFIYNILFCSNNYYNIYYNGEALCGVDQFLNLATEEQYNEFKTSKLNNTNCSTNLREDTLNSIYFIFDYFYGLKEDKKYASFEEAIPQSTKELILSTDPAVFNEGYHTFLQKQLDELHTSMYIKSFYNDPSEGHGIFEEGHQGNFWIEYYGLSADLTAKHKEVYGETFEPLRYYDDTAIIDFESFETAVKTDIYNEDGTVKEDAYLKDTYQLFAHSFKDIETHDNIKNVVIDLSNNGGGNLAAMLKALGFLTDKDIPYSSYDYMYNQFQAQYERVDVDGDGSFKDNDAYTNYNYYIQTSLCTFSAANCYAAVAQNLGAAKIIGEKSGGGMCSVLPVVLADGTSIRMSSTNALHVFNGNPANLDYTPIEHGVDVDIEMPVELFYNDQALVDYIHNSQN